MLKYFTAQPRSTTAVLWVNVTVRWCPSVLNFNGADLMGTWSEARPVGSDHGVTKHLEPHTPDPGEY